MLFIHGDANTVLVASWGLGLPVLVHPQKGFVLNLLNMTAVDFAAAVRRSPHETCFPLKFRQKDSHGFC
jgi:hypothetical protein